MITLSNVPAYSFGRAKRINKENNAVPGPGHYNWEMSKMTVLKNYPNSTIPRSKLRRGNYSKE